MSGAPPRRLGATRSSAGGSLRILTPGGINTFRERIPVGGGDLLGLRVGAGGGAACEFTAAAGNSVRYGAAASEPPPGSTATLPSTLAPRRLNVTARLEPDVDADGYGDETQDACPGSAGPSSGCPSGSTPSKDMTRPVVRLRFRRDSIRDGHIGLWVTASEAVRVTARGTVKIALRSTRASPADRRRERRRQQPRPALAADDRRRPNVPRAAHCVAGNACARGSP